MSVDLTQLPDPLPPLKKFNGWFWGVLLLVFIIVGSIVTLITSFYLSTSNFLFILGCLILPSCVWLFTFLYGIYYRGYREAYIKQWNIHRDQRRKELIDYARRGLFLCHFKLVTELGSAGNATKVVNGSATLETKYFQNSPSPIAHSAIPLPIEKHVSSADFIERLYPIFMSWQNDAKITVAHLPIGVPIHVRLFVDNIDSEDLINLWLKVFGRIITPTSLTVETDDHAVFLGKWLDDSHHDNEFLFIISAHLFITPIDFEAEYASLFLLAGEELYKQHFLPNQLVKAKIYRNEQASEVSKTFDHALLWGALDNKPYDGVWYSNISMQQNVEIMNYFNQIEFDHGHIFSIDTSIGNPYQGNYWLALGLAVEHASTTGNKQLIVVGQPDITASVVASVTKTEQRK